MQNLMQNAKKCPNMTFWRTVPKRIAMFYMFNNTFFCLLCVQPVTTRENVNLELKTPTADL